MVLKVIALKKGGPREMERKAVSGNKPSEGRSANGINRGWSVTSSARI